MNVVGDLESQHLLTNTSSPKTCISVTPRVSKIDLVGLAGLAMIAYMYQSGASFSRTHSLTSKTVQMSLCEQITSNRILMSDMAIIDLCK